MNSGKMKDIAAIIEAASNEASASPAERAKIRNTLRTALTELWDEITALEGAKK